jgi:hypothetical protein
MRSRGAREAFACFALANALPLRYDVDRDSEERHFLDAILLRVAT